MFLLWDQGLSGNGLDMARKMTGNRRGLASWSVLVFCVVSVAFRGVYLGLDGMSWLFFGCFRVIGRGGVTFAG